jgi:hypothetical protein
VLEDLIGVLDQRLDNYNNFSRLIDTVVQQLTRDLQRRLDVQVSENQALKERVVEQSKKIAQLSDLLSLKLAISLSEFQTYADFTKESLQVNNRQKAGEYVSKQEYRAKSMSLCKESIHQYQLQLFQSSSHILANILSQIRSGDQKYLCTNEDAWQCVLKDTERKVWGNSAYWNRRSDRQGKRWIIVRRPYLTQQ